MIRSNIIELDVTIFFAGIGAALVAIFLILTQVDLVSRYIFSPLQLRVNRRKEQIYRIEKAIASSILYIRRYINNGNFYDWSEEKKITDLIWSDDSVQNLVKEIVFCCQDNNVKNIASKKETHGDENKNLSCKDTRKTPLIVGISKDLSLPKGDEWYVHLAFPIIVSSAQEDENQKDHYDYTTRQYGRRVQVPLAKFGTFLAEEFEKQSKNYTLCFIADASSSLGSHVIGDVIQQAKFDIPLIKEPAWIFTLAFLIQTNSLPRQAMEKVLYGFCCLSAQGVLHSVGSRYNTIALTLPGQATTASLLSYLQHLFPTARYLLLSDDCIKSIKRSQSMRKRSSSNKYPNSRKTDLKKELPKHIIPETVMPHDISSSVPIQLVQVKQLREEFASLHYSIAAIVEAWLSSVSAFKQLEDDEDFKGSILTCDLNSILCSHAGLDKGQEENLNSSVKDLLSFILGNSGTSKSLAIRQSEMDAVLSIIAEANENSSSKYESESNLSNDVVSTINRCVRIMIHSSKSC